MNFYICPEKFLKCQNLKFFKRFMTLRSVTTNNGDLIQRLKEYGIISTKLIAQVMTATDRKFYSPIDPYLDAPQDIGYGETISAPHMHAFTLEWLKHHLKPGNHVLDIGSGSGYLAACFFRYIEKKGENHNTKVIGIEHQEELVELSKANLNRDDDQMLKSGKLIIIKGDGRMGCSEYSPYNAIHVGVASSEKPSALIKQLARGGRLIIPIGPEYGRQYIMQYDKDKNDQVNESRLLAVKDVPLTDAPQK